MSGPGQVRVLERYTDALEALIFNFDIDQFTLKSEHEQWFKDNVVSYLQRGGSITVVGLASRTGTAAHNMALSQRRLTAIINFLRKQSPNNFQVAVALAVGEGLAASAGARDGTEDERWRAALISVWSRQKPPPPPPPPPPGPLPAPTPAKVDRVVYAKFLAEFSSSSGSVDDPKSAVAMADATTKYMFDKYGGRSVERRTAKVPASYVLREIYLSPNTAGSYTIGPAKTSMLSYIVTYEWGQRIRPFCVLMDRSREQDPVYDGLAARLILSDWQADMLLNDPFRAVQEMRNWNLKGGWN